MKFDNITNMTLVVALAFVVASLPTAQADEARVETAPYASSMLHFCALDNIAPSMISVTETAWGFGTFLFGTLWPAFPGAEAPDVNQGISTCFEILPNDGQVHVDIQDATFDTVPYYYVFRDAAGNNLGSGIECSNGNNAFPIPAGATTFGLTVTPHAGYSACLDATSSTGVVTVTFT